MKTQQKATQRYVHPNNSIFLPYAQRVTNGQVLDEDREALTTTLVKAYGQRLSAFIKNHFRLEDPEGVLQETYLRLHRSWHRIDWERDVLGYALRTTRNTAINAAHKEKRRTATAFTDLPFFVPELQRAPRAGLTESASIRLLSQALEQVPQYMRAAVYDCHFLGLEYDAIARKHSVPLGTAKSRIHRGTTKFLQNLEELLANEAQSSTEK